MLPPAWLSRSVWCTNLFSMIKEDSSIWVIVSFEFPNNAHVYIVKYLPITKKPLDYSLVM
jgi:hypothetical protein